MAKTRSDDWKDLPEDERGVYSIGTVAEIFKIHEQSLRQYERMGLVVPHRTKGNTRMYSKKDVSRLEIILNLTKELGVNLAGVEIILAMRERMEKLQSQMRELIIRFREHLKHEYEEYHDELEKETAIVPITKERGIAKKQRE